MPPLVKAAAVALLASALGCGAQLPALSPFLPAGTADQPAAEQDAEPQLRGIMLGPSGEEFCLYDPAKKRSVWVRRDDPSAGFSVLATDPARRAVTVLWRGRHLTLVLHAAKALAGTVGGSDGAAAEAAPPRIPGTAGFNPEAFAKLTPEAQAGFRKAAEEADRRLQAERDELQRRQALRAQQGLP